MIAAGSKAPRTHGHSTISITLGRYGHLMLWSEIDG
jgi:hypothetical protein